jgi:hypothetical protein
MTRRMFEAATCLGDALPLILIATANLAFAILQ